MLTVRLAVAHALLIPLLLLAVADYYWSASAPGAWLYPFAALFALAAIGELNAMLADPLGGLSWRQLLPAAVVPTLTLAWPLYSPLWQDQPHTSASTAPSPVAGQQAGALPSVAPGSEPDWFVWLAAGIAGSLAILLLTEMSRFHEPSGNAIRRIAGGLFAIIYLALPLAFLVALRTRGDNQQGMLALVSLVLVVKLSDSGAYLVGARWGRRKLAPRLSPNKTIEGAVAGLGAAAVAAAFAYLILRPWLCSSTTPTNWQDGSLWVVTGMTLGGAAIVGDLAESLLKRDVGRKDSGTWLPGLGGALDVLDSLLWAAPAQYAFWCWGLLQV